VTILRTILGYSYFLLYVRVILRRVRIVRRNFVAFILSNQIVLNINLTITTTKPTKRNNISDAIKIFLNWLITKKCIFNGFFI